MGEARNWEDLSMDERDGWTDQATSEQQRLEMDRPIRPDEPGHLGKPPYQPTDLRDQSADHPVGGRVGESTVHQAIISGGVTSAQVVAGAGDLSQSVRRLTGSHALRRWWMQLAGQEFDRTAPKALEYGSTDLRDIGLTLARSQGRVVSDEEAAELGVYFYLLGKIARWTDAVCRGDRPSDDTLHDLGVYVRMAQRIRAAGGWPGVDKEDNGG